MRVYDEIPTAVLAQFSKLKIEQAPNFRNFRQAFRAKLGRCFLVPANSFDNVRGNFPIGFFIWHLEQKEVFVHSDADVYDCRGKLIGTKGLWALDNQKSINDWLIETRSRPNEMNIGYMSCRSHDVSNVNYNFIMNNKSQMKSPRGTWVTDKNVREVAIYNAVCHTTIDCQQEEKKWLNDRDQFLWPNDGWKTDEEFQSDCLAYTLFSNSNNIKSTEGVNHWIPFTEAEVGARDVFQSHFMHDYIIGKHRPQEKAQPVEQSLFDKPLPLPLPSREGSDMLQDANGKVTTPLPIGEGLGGEAAGALVFSPEATAVMDAARELWRYYHRQPGANPNASYYDIRLHFQGTKISKSGKVQMNADSADEHYNCLVKALRQAVRALAQKIEPKVYEYGFLKA